MSRVIHIEITKICYLTDWLTEWQTVWRRVIKVLPFSLREMNWEQILSVVSICQCLCFYTFLEIKIHYPKFLPTHWDELGFLSLVWILYNLYYTSNWPAYLMCGWAFPDKLGLSETIPIQDLNLPKWPKMSKQPKLSPFPTSWIGFEEISIIPCEYLLTKATSAGG